MIFKKAILFVVSSVLTLTACSSIDEHYKDFLDEAEKAYPGRVDSVRFFPGYQRAVLNGLLSTDPRVVRVQINWGDGNSADEVVNPDEIAARKSIQLDGMQEGSYTFDIRTFDADGNRSMRTEIVGRVYGDAYISSLNNRVIQEIDFEDDKGVVNWFPETGNPTLLGTIVTYASASNTDSVQVFTSSQENTTSLPGLLRGSTISYRTLFKPEENAIDTFYAAVAVREIEE